MFLFEFLAGIQHQTTAQATLWKGKMWIAYQHAVFGWEKHTAISSTGVFPGGRCLRAVVLGSPVQSGLLSNFDMTRTGTSPHRLKNLKKLD
jgi:hypothetical protein